MQVERAALPIHRCRPSLMAALAAHGCAVVTAPTGSGKSTQVAQFLLEDLPRRGRILVLQPRRLAAVMLAERVSAERGESVGGIVGYQTRFERAVSERTRVLFVTAGVLPRMLMSNRDLRGVTAVVFDEFHERSLIGDIGLSVTRDLQRARRPDLCLVVMSATLSASPVQAFLGDCPHVHAEGRVYPVSSRHVTGAGRSPVWDLAAAVLQEVLRDSDSGDVLIFMPGAYEIRRTLEACRRIRSSGPLTLLPLYGDLDPEVQRQVMIPAAVGRKVIVATNIAETSLTIPGVRHVIDSGLVRQNRYDPGRGINMLEVTPISRDSADQRAGRAGREAAGTCHRLWTLAEQHRKPSETLPEVRRVDLSEAVLLLHALGYKAAADFRWFEAPRSEAAALAAQLLRDLDIVTPRGGTLTQLGRQVARLPLHPRLGLLVCLGRREGCFAEAALAAEILSERPLTMNRGKASPLRRQGKTPGGAREPAAVEQLPQSDLLLLMDLLQGLAAKRFQTEACAQVGIHGGAARQVWRAWRHLLGRHGQDLRLDLTRHGEGLLRCLLRAFPDRLGRRRDAGSLLCDLRGGVRGQVARESSVRDERLIVAGEIREVSGHLGGTPPVLSLLSGVREEWLWDYFPDQWEDVDETVWDERRNQAHRHRRLSCLGVVIEETVGTDVDPETASRLLAERVRDGRLRLHGWDAAVDAWIDRVRWVAEVFPERGLLTYDDDELGVIREEICAGRSSYRQVKAIPCLDTVRHALSYDDIGFVERMAPLVLMLPSGQRLKIQYKPGQPPRGRATIQQLYGVTTSPTVAAGKRQVLLEILAPNRRTVQITDSMERFWRDIYPGARRELARRYPKHEWR